MSRDPFSDTKEIPLPHRPQQPVRPGEPRGRRPQSAAHTGAAVHRQEQSERTDARQSERRVSPQQRQRLQPPPPYPTSGVVRRASYQEQLPEGGNSVPRRRPPQTYHTPEFDYYEEEEPAPRPPRKKKKRRHRHRRSCVGRILFALLTTAVVLVGIYSGLALLAIKQLDYEETGARQLSYIANEPDPDVRNILLIGTDSREGETGRADTMILMSFSKHNKSVTMTSLLRDSYVSIPNYGTNKLNAAFAYGGATLLMDTITNNYGIPVDDYVCVNFKAFVHIADALGGLKVEISDREAEAINVILQSEVNAIMGDDPMSDFLPSGGTFLLNGKQALAYARIRYVGNADFERTERQRTVLDLILEKLKHPNPAAIPKILVKAMPELKTNMTTSELYLLSLQLPVELITYDMQKLRLPADGTFSDQTAPDGQMVLAVDFDANLQLYLKAVNEPLHDVQKETEITS